MRTTIMLVVVSAILLFAAGCGPGDPFEIEGLHSPQPPASMQVAVVR